MKEKPLIECRDLTKIYPHRKESLIRAVDGIDLKIYSGDFAVIVGRSGTGKSTLLNLMGGLDRPTSGTVTLNGKALEKTSDKELALVRMKEIGFVFQDFNLLSPFTVFENIEIALAPSRLSRKERQERVKSLLQTFDLEARADHLPSQLSIGQQQEVALARALVNDPSIILADEPTGGVDPITAGQVAEKLLELNQKHKVTLMITTHGTFPLNIASRVVYMKNGRFVSQEEAGY